MGLTNRLKIHIDSEGLMLFESRVQTHGNL